MPRRTWTTLPLRCPRTLVVVALGLAALGGVIYGSVLEIQTGRRQLSAPDRPLNRRAAAFREQFDVRDELLLCITTAPPDAVDAADAATNAQRARMIAVAREFCAALRRFPDSFPAVPDVTSEVDDGGPFALLYVPEPAFTTLVEQLEAALPWLTRVAERPTFAGTFAALREELGALGAAADDDVAARRLGAGLRAANDALAWLTGTLREPPGAPVDTGPLAAALRDAAGLDTLATGAAVMVGGGRMLLLPVAVDGQPGTPNEYGLALERARAALDEALESADASPVLHAGFAGPPALEAEEVATSQRDFGRGALIALLLVSVVFAAAFRSWLRPALAAVCLGIAVGITFLFTWLAIGHLNLVAMVFAIVLVALGVDFAIHFATHYELALDRGVGRRRAIATTLRHVGRALCTGGLTTAAAFGAAGLTEAPGLHELGIVAGGGIVICLAVMLLVYPAMLAVFDRGHRRPQRPDHAPPPAHPARPAREASAALLPHAAVVVLAVVGLAVGQYEFDTNLLALQPTDGTAARWQGALIGIEDRTQFAVATFEDRADLEAAQRRLVAATDLVSTADGPFPEHEAEKRARLAPLGTALARLQFTDPLETPERRELRRELFGLRADLRRLGDADPQAAAALAPLTATLDGLYAVVTDVDPARLAGVESALRERIRTTVAALAARCLPPEEIDPDRVPAPVRRRHVARDGDRRLALFVHPAFDTWDGDARSRFVTGVLDIEPGLFGGVVNLDDNSAVMVRSFRNASTLALVLVLVLTFVGTRSLRRTALAILPLITSLGLLLLLMKYGAHPVPWNFANFFALAILIGIGVDSGIHLVEAWRQGAVAWRGARRAVIVSTSTTLIGFGVLASSGHLGVRSLGIVLAQGIALVLLTSLLLLPEALRRLPPDADRPPSDGPLSSDGG